MLLPAVWLEVLQLVWHYSVDQWYGSKAAQGTHSVLWFRLDREGYPRTSFPHLQYKFHTAYLADQELLNWLQ